jgi:hypothetical protein
VATRAHGYLVASGQVTRAAACKLGAGGSRRGGQAGDRPHSWTGYYTGALVRQQPLHLASSRLALGEAFLGLQQPMHHQQLAQQVVQGLAGGSPVRIGHRPGEERMGLL